MNLRSVFFVCLLSPSLALAQDLFRVNNTTALTIDKHNICRKVDNNSGFDVMVPAKTLPEWQAFIASATPAGVTKNQCDCVCPDASFVALGAACTGGGICAGKFKGNRYMILPGNCDGTTASPTCDNAADTNILRKYWNDGTVNWYDIPGVENIGTGGGFAQIPSTVLGDVNSPAIVAITAPAEGGVHQAAKYCDDMTYGGYTDWYLPSKSELVYLYCNSNRSAFKDPANPQESVNCDGDYTNFTGTSTALAGFAIKSYWSSTEITTGAVGDRAWAVSFTDGFITRVLKFDNPNSFLYVRCVRRY